MSEAFACPCCGHRTFPSVPGGTWFLCPVCAWEDVAADEAAWSRTHGATLREAQRHYEAHGCCAPGWEEVVRAPTAQEAREAGWLTLDARQPMEREAALAAIEAAFGSLVRGDGMRIYEAELRDSYALEHPSFAGRKHDTYQRWQDIPDEAIANHYSVLSFFDPTSFRFHVAAYMRFALRHPDWPSNSQEFVVYALMLKEGELEAWCREKFAVFDQAQARAVVRFLEYVRSYETYSARSATEALDAYWRERAGRA